MTHGERTNLARGFRILWNTEIDMTQAINCSVRECGLHEAEAVLHLWRQAEATPSATDTLHDVQRVIAAGAVLVAEVEGRLVGSILGVFDGWRGNMYRLAVHPDYRRRGIARTLVAAAERRLVQQGARRIAALVERDHPWAVQFWQAVGYPADPRLVRHVRTLGP